MIELIAYDYQPRSPGSCAGEKPRLLKQFTPHGIIAGGGFLSFRGRFFMKGQQLLMLDQGKSGIASRSTCEQFNQEQENDHKTTSKQTQDVSVETGETPMASLSMEMFYDSPAPGTIAASEAAPYPLSDGEQRADEDERPKASKIESSASTAIPHPFSADSDGDSGILEGASSYSRLTDSLSLARSFLTGQHYAYWAGQAWRYVGTHYVSIPEENLKAGIRLHVNDLYEKHKDFQLGLIDTNSEAGVSARIQRLRVNRSLIDEVLEDVRALTILAPDADPPYWRTQKEGCHLLSTESGLLDLAAARPTLYQHTPSLFITAHLPYRYDPTASCGPWLAFLEETLSGDAERIESLQQWFGLNLVPNCECQALMLLYGPPGTGKSVICAVLTALLGEANVSNVDLRSLQRQFGLTPLVGKLANIVSDLSSRERIDEGLLKRLIDGAPVEMDRKYKDVIKLEPKARWTLATNRLPEGIDPQDGIWRRVIIMPCTRIVPADRIVLGMSNPKWWLQSGQLPGILNWAIEGLYKFQRASVLRRPSISADVLEEHLQATDHTYTFLSTRVKVAEGKQVSQDKLYNLYSTTSAEAKIRPISKAGFAQRLRIKFPGARSRRLGSRGSEREKVWEGIAVVTA